MAKQIVLLDYGHSKVDPINGKCSPDRSFYEWQFNRTLGRKIANRLRGQGIQVIEIVTESEDEVKVTPSQRAQRANDLCAKYGTTNCMYVSIHANAAGNGTQWMNARGWSVFVSKNCSDASKQLADCIFDAVEKEDFKMRKPLPTQKYWQENFTVLYKTKCKAVLTENLFYDNKEDLALLKDEATIQKLLNAHVNGILKYMGIEPDTGSCNCCCDCCKKS
ncbi:MAG: N-acetylmuramoyl-L-alanine amidase [Bacteroidales bacterium]|nr:N-acetylmuramoyl-L-alanine amidase [Bacteroidales bacterium]